MLNIFSKGKPPKKRKVTQKTDEQLERALDRKHKNWAREKTLERAKQDPDFERQYISQLMGFEIKPTDPSEKSKQELNSVISKAAIDEIKSDPDLVKQLARKRISETVGILTNGSDDNEEGYESRDPIEEVLDRLEQDDLLKEKLGISKDGSGGTGLLIKGILDSEFGKTLAQGFIAIVASARQPQTNTQPEKVYVVQVEGQMKEIRESEYKALLSRNVVKPIGLVEAPKESPKQEVPPTIEEKPTDSELPEFLTDDRIQTIANYLELSPEDVVLQLEAQSLGSEENESQAILQIIPRLNYDQIKGFAMQYVNHSKIGYLAKKIISDEGKLWVEKIITLVTEKSDEL